jgi:mannose/cellobiose epimerase-like protein (N-acyl-D-glucosamine 2-epimerase family)
MDPGSEKWRDEQRRNILTFARRSRRHEGGFAWLDGDGGYDSDANLQLWINARMTYVFALAHLAGDADALELAEHGVQAIAMFHDDEHGGWFAEVGVDGAPSQTGKFCYEHAFVLLAACAASAAGAEGATELLDEATLVHRTKFWDVDAGRCREEWNQDWSALDGYRGANSNMHSVEAFLFVADVTGDDAWRQRALAICERVIGIHARGHEWRIPEHYDHDWTPIANYNVEQPADPFRPFGATPGHAFEWARLIVQLAASLDEPRPWMREAAEGLFTRAVADAVSDDAPAIPYTTDWHGQSVVDERFHWVIVEAVLAAEALGTFTDEALYDGLARRWWSEIDEYFVDHKSGSWVHELSPTMGPSARTWQGRPDAYHAFNAVTLPSLPLAPCAAKTIDRLAQ